MRGLGALLDATHAPEARYPRFDDHVKFVRAPAREPDMTAFDAPHLDQGRLGFCVGFSVAALLYGYQAAHGVTEPVLASPALPVYQAQMGDGSGLGFDDRGCAPYWALRGVQQWGWAPWDAWKYAELLALAAARQPLEGPTLPVRHQAYDARGLQFLSLGGDLNDAIDRALALWTPPAVTILVDESLHALQGEAPLVRSIDTSKAVGRHRVNPIKRLANGDLLVRNWWRDLQYFVLHRDIVHDPRGLVSDAHATTYVPVLREAA